jgi:hypothetical protein
VTNKGIGPSIGDPVNRWWRALAHTFPARRLRITERRGTPPMLVRPPSVASRVVVFHRARITVRARRTHLNALAGWEEANMSDRPMAVPPRRRHRETRNAAEQCCLRLGRRHATYGLGAKRSITPFESCSRDVVVTRWTAFQHRAVATVNTFRDRSDYLIL